MTGDVTLCGRCAPQIEHAINAARPEKLLQPSIASLGSALLFRERIGPAHVEGLPPPAGSESNMAQERKDKDSLEAREYRDEKGEVHHHTKAYMEQHGGKTESAGSRQLRGAEQGEDGRLGELFLETLKDIYTAEKQMLRAMGRIGRQSQSDQLRQALQKHADETEAQVERLEQVFEMLGKPARGKPCDAIEGLINEAREIMEEFKGTDALDAGLLSAAQAIEHYEIARYGTLKTWAGQLGMRDAAKLLDETLQEEKKTDAILTKIAEERVNQRAGTGPLRRRELASDHAATAPIRASGRFSTAGR